MRKNSRLVAILFSLFLFKASKTIAQDTFSIVAVDSATGEVGSAGASCVDLIAAGITDASFLGELFPGRGAINTQASYNPGNQVNARNRMNAGDTPSQIIAWLQANDAGSDNTIRQYGIAALVGGIPQTAAFTGANCPSYANHITGHHYSIQGNILLGKKVLDSMEARFNRATGSLACKLMAALQGAKMPGADTRCAPNNTSSLFAFLKVSKPGDAFGSPYINIGVRTAGNSAIEPIDSLQVIANNMGLCNITGMEEKNLHGKGDISIVPNPAFSTISVINRTSHKTRKVTISDALGRIQLSTITTQDINIGKLARGIYFIDIVLADAGKQRLKLVKYP